MMSNFFFPSQTPYSQSSLNEFLYNQMIYSQIYQGNQYQNINFWQANRIEHSTTFQKDRFSLENHCEAENPIPQQISFNVQKVQQSELKSEVEKPDEKAARQKYGRNITSNIFRCLLKRISGSNRFKKIAQRIIQEKGLTITYERFIMEVNQLSLKLKSYVKKNQMRRFIVPQRQEKISHEFSQIFRILSRVYLKQQHISSIFYSKKISKQSRRLHFMIVRQMEGLLR